MNKIVASSDSLRFLPMWQWEKTKQNKQNNLFHASSWWNGEQEGEELQKKKKALGRATGNDVLEGEAAAGSEACRFKQAVAAGGGWEGAGRAKTMTCSRPPSSSGLCNLAAEGRHPISVTALCCGFLWAEVSRDSCGPN